MTIFDLVSAEFKSKIFVTLDPIRVTKFHQSSRMFSRHDSTMLSDVIILFSDRWRKAKDTNYVISLFLIKPVNRYILVKPYF